MTATAPSVRVVPGRPRVLPPARAALGWRDWLALAPFLAWKGLLVYIAVWLAQQTAGALLLEAEGLSQITATIAGECLLASTLYVLIVEVVGDHLLTQHWSPAIRVTNAVVLPVSRWLVRRRPRQRFQRRK